MDLHPFIEASLAELPRDRLVEVVRSLVEDSPRLQRQLEHLLRSFATPLPAWIVSDVLLSHDLLPHLFASLRLDSWRTARVCKTWRVAWRAHVHKLGYVLDTSIENGHPDLNPLSIALLSPVTCSTAPRLLVAGVTQETPEMDEEGMYNPPGEGAMRAYNTGVMSLKHDSNIFDEAAATIGDASTSDWPSAVVQHREHLFIAECGGMDKEKSMVKKVLINGGTVEARAVILPDAQRSAEEHRGYGWHAARLGPSAVLDSIAVFEGHVYVADSEYKQVWGLDLTLTHKAALLQVPNLPCCVFVAGASLGVVGTNCICLYDKAGQPCRVVWDVPYPWHGIVFRCAVTAGSNAIYALFSSLQDHELEETDDLPSGSRRDLRPRQPELCVYTPDGEHLQSLDVQTSYGDGHSLCATESHLFVSEWHTGVRIYSML